MQGIVRIRKEDGVQDSDSSDAMQLRAVNCEETS
jgi:hypothetical protein